MKVFLSYAKEDAGKARRLKRDLVKSAIDVWFDQDSLLPGQPWASAISRAIRESDYFIVLLSSTSVDKRGYVQAEIRQAIEVADQQPPHVAYLIPVRLNDCKPTHERLSAVQWVDLFPRRRNGVLQLLRRLAPDACAAASTAVAATPPLRTDGVYVAKTQGPYPYHYLRFLTNNIVVGCPSAWSTRQIAPWLTADNKDIASGTYSVRTAKGRTAVVFQARSVQGIVDYRGYLVLPDLLVVKKHSQITGYRDIEEYRFRSVRGLGSGSPAIS